MCFVGWRPTDGTKLNRPATGPAFSSMGWGYDYDGGVRLASASSAIDAWSFGYGTGDERTLTSRAKGNSQQDGETNEFGTGPDGRIASRDDIPYGYDRSGRRTEDERFEYSWSWRGELLAALVKDEWPDADGNGEPDQGPFAGHEIRYTYDALGRLLVREHRGRAPEGGGDRPFLELREYVWDGWGLANEIAYGSPDKTQPRWRKTFVPGSGGLDNAVQVLVDVEPTLPSPYAGEARLFTYLRDEMGSVVGLVAEDESTDPNHPVIPVRYLYTPYGEAHAETGPELRRAFFDGEVTTAGASVQDEIADPTLLAAGALITERSIALDEETLADHVIVERLDLDNG